MQSLARSGRHSLKSDKELTQHREVCLQCFHKKNWFYSNAYAKGLPPTLTREDSQRDPRKISERPTPTQSFSHAQEENNRRTKYGTPQRKTSKTRTAVCNSKYNNNNHRTSNYRKQKTLPQQQQQHQQQQHQQQQQQQHTTAAYNNNNNL